MALLRAVMFEAGIIELMDKKSNTRAKSIAKALLRWYEREHRKLPWRAAPGELSDPYRTLVSEAMLQQTQVATVVDYFNRFIARFPTVAALAAAEEGEVLAMWQGLGYYRRARHLYKAARVIVDEHDGRLPTSAAELIKLPGVGRYTAGAVASMAHGEVTPVVDGNVSRVLARLEGYGEAVDATAGSRWVWARAGELVERACAVGTRGPKRPRALGAGDWNQAVMELGATVCLPRRARCGQCPLNRWCRAKAEERVDQLPVMGKRTSAKAVTHRVIAIERGGRWLFVQRGDEGLWAGMWQVPAVEDGGTPGTKAPPGFKGEGRPSAAGLKAWVRERFRLEIGRAKWVGAFEHVTTHRRVRFEVWRAEATGGRLRRGAGVWRRRDAVSDLAISRAMAKVLGMLGGD